MTGGRCSRSETTVVGKLYAIGARLSRVPERPAKHSKVLVVYTSASAYYTSYTTTVIF